MSMIYPPVLMKVNSPAATQVHRPGQLFSEVRHVPTRVYWRGNGARTRQTNGTLQLRGVQIVTLSWYFNPWQKIQGVQIVILLFNSWKQILQEKMVSLSLQQLRRVQIVLFAVQTALFALYTGTRHDILLFHSDLVWKLYPWIQLLLVPETNRLGPAVVVFHA